MDNSRITEILDRLSGNIDDLDGALQALVSVSVADTTEKLPLLDRAKLYVLIVYAIESILFSYLRLNGVDGKAHPVFRELTRVKQYFEKIKEAEGVSETRSLTLDKAAAARFIKNGLSGNTQEETSGVTESSNPSTDRDSIDTENARKRKLVDSTDQIGGTEESPRSSTSENNDGADSSLPDSSLSTTHDGGERKKKRKKNKKRKRKSLQAQ